MYFKEMDFLDLRESLTAIIEESENKYERIAAYELLKKLWLDGVNAEDYMKDCLSSKEGEKDFEMLQILKFKILMLQRITQNCP